MTHLQLLKVHIEVAKFKQYLLLIQDKMINENQSKINDDYEIVIQNINDNQSDNVYKIKIENQHQNVKRKKSKDQRKKNNKYAYDFRAANMMNHLCKWIKRQRKIQKINDMRCQLANDQFLNHYNPIEQDQKQLALDIKKYKDLIRVCQFQEESKISIKYLIQQLDKCYLRKYWKQRNYLTLLFYQDQEDFIKNFKTIYRLYEKFTHNIDIFYALENIFRKLFEIGKQNLKPLLMIYTTDFIIERFEQFRDYYIYFIQPSVDNSDRLLFANCLLYNFLIGYVNHELLSNPINIVNSIRLFGGKFQLRSLYGMSGCKTISKQTWMSLGEVLFYISERWSQKVIIIIECLFNSQLYRTALKGIDESFYKDIKYNFEQNTYCVLIQQLNIKGFIHRSGKIFINVYPVLKSCNLDRHQLFTVLKAYCILVIIIAVNQHQILTQYQEYLIDVIESKISNINQPRLALFKQLFGVKQENSNQSNLTRINHHSAKIIIRSLKTMSDLYKFQENINQSILENQDSSYIYI
ncbi:hypothetical protein pb186bvf_014730 [Paramecium bursaria]